MDFRLVLLSYLLSFACVLAQSSDSKKDKKEDEKKKVDGKVVGGTAVNINAVAYTASLSRLEGRNRRMNHFCGGSIIHPQYILTAAHCIADFARRPTNLFVRTGSTTINKGGQVTPVDEVIKHPNYNTRTVERDLALLHTSKPMTVGGIGGRKTKVLFEKDIAILKLICPLDLSNTTKMIKIARREPSPGTYGIVTGWGLSNEKGSKPMENLQYAYMPTIERRTCQRSYSGMNPVTDSMICAGFRTGGVDACQGDSGGPFVVGDEQVGVVSWGRGCARPGNPGVFTNLANPSLRSWIARYVPIA